MTTNKVNKLIGKQVTEVEPILDSKGNKTNMAYLIFSGNYRLKVKLDHA